MVVHLSLLLERLQAVLGLVFAGDVTPHCVVACEGTAAEGTRHTYPLMTLTNVST